MRICAALAAFAVVLTGCDAKSSTTTEPAPIAGGSASASAKLPPPIAWEQTLDRIGADGQLDKGSALAAFALAVRPLPGVTVPEAGAGGIASGTIAVTSVMRHQATLTEPQRRVVLEALACPRQDDPGTDAQRDLADEVRREIESKWGRPLRLKLFIQSRPQPAQALSWSCGDACVIRLAAGADATRASLIREVMQCFFFDRYGKDHVRQPAWFRDGAPMWVAGALGSADAAVSRSWTRYLDTPTRPLAKRTSDAIGFFVHLAETGTEPWAVLDAIGLAVRSGDTPAGWRAARVSQGFLDSWGSGFVQGRHPGTAWTSSGAGLPSHQPELERADIDEDENTVIAAEPTAARSVRLDVDAEVVVVKASAGARGRLTVGGGRDLVLRGEQAGPMCTLDAARCSCPRASENAAAKFSSITKGEQFLGLTGGLERASVAFSGMSLTAFCNGSPLAGIWMTTAIVSHAELGQARWDLRNGGAGVRVVIGRTGNVTAIYDEMKPLAYTMYAGSHLGQRGRMSCSGKETGSLQMPEGDETAGAWSYRLGRYDQVGTVTITHPFTGVLTFGPDKGGCAVGAFARGLPLSGTWRLSARNLALTVRYSGTGDVQGAKSRWDIVWTLKCLTPDGGGCRPPG
jgi:hypothetical protein